jgi:hypothetical protein
MGYMMGSLQISLRCFSWCFPNSLASFILFQFHLKCDFKFGSFCQKYVIIMALKYIIHAFVILWTTVG